MREPSGIIFYLEGGREKEAKLVDDRMTISGDSYYWYKVDENLSRLKYFVIHHSVTPANYTPEQIAQIHLARNWNGIGYHFVITQDGVIHYVGDLGTWRANVLGRNHEVIGVLLVGDFRDGRKPTEAQYRAANVLFREFKADSRFTGIKTNASLKFHNELQATACPCDVNKDWIANGIPVTPPVKPIEPKPVAPELPKPTPGIEVPTEVITPKETIEYKPVEPLKPQEPTEIPKEEETPHIEPINNINKENDMETIKEKLTSRKFWVMVVSVAYFIANGMTNEAVAIVLGYLGIQGYQDSKK